MKTPQRISAVEFRGLAAGKPAKRSKFGNRKTTVDGIVFDSAKEARRYSSLKLLERAGKIRELRLQVDFPITVEGELVCTYVADFVYEEHVFAEPPLPDCADPDAPFWTAPEREWIWLPVVEDAKGFRTPEYRLKAKLMRAVHRITIRET